MLHFPLSIPKGKLSGKVILIWIFTDIPNKVRSLPDMLGKLRDVATLREVHMVDAWDDLGDC